jgi:hypothetical protein
VASDWAGCFFGGEEGGGKREIDNSMFFGLTAMIAIPLSSVDTTVLFHRSFQRVWWLDEAHISAHSTMWSWTISLLTLVETILSRSNNTSSKNPQ